MVRAVIGDEKYVEGYIDSILQSGVTLQMGLAIGRLGTGSGRDVVFSLIPTPQNEGQEVVRFEGEFAKEVDKRKGKKGNFATPSLQIDMDWVVEHARQVSKMLVGGIKVVGCFILANESVFKSSAALLWQTSKMIALALDASRKKLSLDELLLLHFSFAPRRVVCRNSCFEAGYGSSSFRPCEWKSAKAYSNLHSVSCLYNLECRLPVYADKPSRKRLVDTLLSAIVVEETRLESAIVVSGGSLVEDKADIGDTNHEVELFQPVDCPPTDSGNGAVTGLVILSGVIQAHAYAFSRDPWSRAVTDLKADIVKSLRSRLEILQDEIDDSLQDSKVSPVGERALDPLQSVEGSKEFRCKLPRRLLFPWFEGVYLCDYLQEGESLQDVTGRIKELLNIDKMLDQSKVLEQEGHVGILTERTFWEATVQSRSTKEDKREQQVSVSHKVVKATTLNSKTFSLLSIFVLFLAIFTSYFLMTRVKSI